MFSTSNCTSIGKIFVESCGVGKFCCIDGCCIDYTYVVILLIIISMIAIVAVFIHVELMKERRFNNKLKKHMQSCNQDLGFISEIEETRIFLGASPIDACPFNLPPSCSPPIIVPKLKLHRSRPIRQFLHKHL